MINFLINSHSVAWSGHKNNQKNVVIKCKKLFCLQKLIWGKKWQKSKWQAKSLTEASWQDEQRPKKTRKIQEIKRGSAEKLPKINRQRGEWKFWVCIVWFVGFGGLWDCKAPLLLPCFHFLLIWPQFPQKHHFVRCDRWDGDQEVDANDSSDNLNVKIFGNLELIEDSLDLNSTVKNVQKKVLLCDLSPSLDSKNSWRRTTPGM